VATLAAAFTHSRMIPENKLFRQFGPSGVIRQPKGREMTVNNNGRHYGDRKMSANSRHQPEVWHGLSGDIVGISLAHGPTWRLTKITSK